MVIARHLHNRESTLRYSSSPRWRTCRGTPDPGRDPRKLDLEIRVIRDTEGVEDLRSYLEEVHLCVDAILGRASPCRCQESFVKWWRWSTCRWRPCLPSTSRAASTPRRADPREAIRADYTGVLGLPKIGNVILPGSIHCGETEIYDIGIPSRAVFEAEIKTETLEEQVVKSMLSVRPPDFHKGDAGRVFVVGGSPGMTGAPCLSGLASLRMGAGLVTVAVPASLRPIVEAKQMEVMSVGVPDGGGGHFTPEMIPDLLAAIARADFVVVGPGLGLTESTPGFLKELLPRLKVPFLLDADALNALEGQVDVLQTAGATCIVTPHTGEMSRLTRESVEAIEASRLDSARHLAEEESVTVVLKGPRTIVATPKGDIFINMSGNPYMASAGMGDALTGMIAALASQGLSTTDAACAGVFLHGLSADLLVRKHPMTPVTALDVIGNIKGALQHTMDELPPEE